ncbi:MAG: secretin N-terminal domain-containing protein [Planctomycetaceae bacterium]|nr:secretin N-terminal domain-containing protein [Planctomycetaceae bacterium]
MHTARYGWRSIWLTGLTLLVLGTATAQPPGGFGPGGPGGGRGGPRGGDPSSLISNLSDNSFQEQLQLTDEQQTKLGDLRGEMREAMMSTYRDGSFRDIPEDQRRAKFQEMNRPFEERAAKLLTPTQTATWEKRKVEVAAQAAAAGGATPGAPTPAASTAVSRRQALPNEPVPEGADVMASFKPTGDGPAIHRPGEDAILVFNFRYAPWTEVLELFADAAGLTLDLNDVPQGTFNYYTDSRPYTATQALDIINGYLLPKGYIVIRRDRFLTCFNLDDPLPPNVIPLISPSELPHRGKNELLSVLVPLEAGYEADKVVGEIRDLLGPYGKASSLKNTNSLVIQDMGANLSRIYDLVKSGTPPDTRETAFKAIALQHISAAEAERMVRRLFGLSQVTTVSSAQTPQFGGFGGSPFGGFGGSPFGGFGGSPFGGFSGFSRDGSRDGGSRDGGSRDGGSRDGDSRSSSSSSNPTSSRTGSFGAAQQSPYQGKIQITADARTNHLMVTASAALIKVVEEVVKSLDVDTGVKPSDSPVVLKVYDVTGDATQVAYTLSLMMPGLAIIDDPRSAKLHVQATAEEHAEVAKLVQQLSSGGANSVAVIPLTRLDPVAATNSIRNLFVNEGTRGPSIEADVQFRRLMIRGTPDQLAQIKALLTSLGEINDPNAVGEPANRGNVRTFPLAGRDPEEFLPILRQMWSASGPNPLRIVVPSQASPVRDRKVPSQSQLPGGGPSSSLAPSPIRERFVTPLSIPVERRPAQPEAVTAGYRSLFSVSSTNDGIVDADEQDQDPVDEDEQSAEPAPAKDFDDFLKSFLEPAAAPKPATDSAAMPNATGDAPVGVTVVGGEVVLTSSDKEALDQMEKLMETLAAAMPPRTQWTVFYLRSADATETAQMLERLFPQSSVSTSTQQSDGILGSLAGGFSSVGRGMMNVTGLNNTLGGQSLRIVTDIRANALFVTGPSDMVAQVEMMLQTLDASELPGTLRDRVPRYIPVEYADVEDVAALVESVFKDAMTAEQPQQQQGGRGGGFNPLAMMMGQAGQQGKAKGPELTLGVDRQTSNLIVSCSDTLFRQVEDLVLSADERARNLRQSVQVVPLIAADPMLVSTTISALMPKVTVSGNRTARSQTSSSSTRGSQPGQTGQNNTSGNAAAPDPSQEMMRMMMEQRFRGGGGDSGRGGPGGGFSRGPSSQGPGR